MAREPATPEWKLDNLILSLGPTRDSPFPTCIIAGDVPTQVLSHIGLDYDTDAAIKSQWRWHSFSQGAEANSWFAVMHNVKRNTHSIKWGAAISPALYEWLAELKKTDGRNKRRQTVKIAFGPRRSFLAWDCSSVRWSGLSPSLEQTIQSWFTPTGWKYGPPVVVSIGLGFHYFISTEEGKVAHTIFDADSEVDKVFADYRSKHLLGRGVVKNICFGLTAADEFIIVENTRCVKGNYHSLGRIYDVVDRTYSDEERKLRERVRAEEQRRQGQNKRKLSITASPSKRQRTARSAAEDLAFSYRIWKTTYQDLFASEAKIRAFPIPPTHACKCTLPECVPIKAASSLLACRHEVERLLRASGQYSLAWLQKERTQWHPDMFGRKCDVRFKLGLEETATELFQIFQALIDAEPHTYS